MTSRDRSPLWVRSLTGLGRVLLRAYPREVLDLVGREMLEALEHRLIERRDRSGVFALIRYVSMSIQLITLFLLST